MGINEHLLRCKQTDDAHMPNFVAAIRGSDDLRQHAQEALQAIDQSVLSRCWLTKRHFDILTQALGA